MRAHVLGLIAWLTLTYPEAALAENGRGSDADPPVASISGARTVVWSDQSGKIGFTSTIPSSSAFAVHDGGRTRKCTFRTLFNTTVDGTEIAGGDLLEADYWFIAGDPPAPIPPQPDELAPDAPLNARGPLQTATRTFSVYCGDPSRFGHLNFMTIIEVPYTDPVLAVPRATLDTLRGSLQLARPTIYPNPVVDRFGGLVTRYPSWLAIHPDAWQSQRSGTATYRGAALYLYAQPRQLDFTVEFTPNPEKPSPPYRGVIACIPDLPATDDGTALPALPTLPDQTEPGPNGPCMWTPPGPGHVTITARITYTTTLWIDGYTRAEPDYTWTSDPTTFLTGELLAVNTDPNG